MEKALVPCLAFISLAWSTPVISAEDYETLFIGNSHSSSHDLPGMVSLLIEAGEADVTSTSALAPGWGFLADRIGDGVTRPMLESRPWSHVILQAQKYSSSGLYIYPTDAAEEWIRRVRSQGAEPILFPEWPRRGNREEGPRVHQLHLSIAAREPACVAPIGLAWEATIAQYPGMALHAADGNHSNPRGALLTAFVLYEVITGRTASELPYVSEIDINEANQRKLRNMASETVAVHAETCPAVQGVNGLSGTLERGIPTLGAWGLIVLGLAVSAVVIGFSRAGWITWRVRS